MYLDQKVHIIKNIKKKNKIIVKMVKIEEKEVSARKRSPKMEKSNILIIF